MSLTLEVKSIISPDLDYGKPHWEPENCAVLVEAEIGERDKEGADIFSFSVITPQFLSEHPETRWGRGYLLMNSFSWKETEQMLIKLLSFVKEDSWDRASQELCKELHWEYENYQE